jgi:hypothetical protein
MRSAKRQLRLLTTCLAPRHQARSLVCRSRFSTTCRGTKAEPHLSLAILYHLPRHQGGASFVARILYHLRSFTRATRFACASTPFDERPEPHSGSLPTALIHPRRLLVLYTHSAIAS